VEAAAEEVDTDLRPRGHGFPGDRRVEGGTIDVSVVICACAAERFGDLGDAIESVALQTVPALETIVVVDHNPTLAERVAARWPAVAVVESSGQRGVSAARNTALVAAGGSVIAFLDDDAVAAPDWLENMIRVYREEGVMAVGGDIEPLWQSGRPPWFPAEFGWVVGCGYTGLPRERAAVRNVIGTNMSFRRDVFDGIGGFDSAIGRVGRIPVGCDETELCVRARQRWPERTIVHDPRVKVSHRVPARRANLKYFVSRCYGEGRSKALVSRRVGPRDALSTEMRYATRTLPAGIWHGLRDASVGDRYGLGRAGAIVIGLAVTSAGFVGARLGRVSGKVLLRA
jgi:glycosyltransferase involved in cell wall biosynthesis